MRIEYRLQFSAPDAQSVATVIRRIPGAREIEAVNPRFDLGCGASVESVPQAMVQVEPYGVYFCDYCAGSGRELLGAVVARLVSRFGAVTVEEL
jgi:hypothetical protein